ncbi:MAG: glycosyltransferase family 2 protein, partial [Myxococcota bacterium]
MLLSILIPVYNEVNTAKSLIEKVLSVKFDADVELIVVNDASTDGTEEILNGISDGRVKIIHHPENRGKGAAIKTAINNAKGDYIVIQDADLEYNPEDINLLLKKAYEGYEAIFGSRFYNGRPEDENILHYMGNRFLTTISNIFSGLRLTDMETCYKMIKRSLFELIT